MTNKEVEKTNACGASDGAAGMGRAPCTLLSDIAFIPYAARAPARTEEGGLAQLARAPALQAGGQRFESVILHLKKEVIDILED